MPLGRRQACGLLLFSSVLEVGMGVTVGAAVCVGAGAVCCDAAVGVGAQTSGMLAGGFTEAGPLTNV